ncbi:MAG: tellurite resistance TerB family protein [Myxococcales bacterium]|nr:tellurite resistance TerB family protein [Myxococcales bacterium]
MDDTTRSERSRILGATLPDDLGAAAPALQRDDQADPEAAQLHTMLEVAYLAAAADGELADAEIHHLAANLSAWLQAELDQAFLIKLFEHLGAQLAAEGATARLTAAAASLDAEARRTAYKLACVTALCDLEVHDDELGFLSQIAAAFEIPMEEAQATFDELDEAVTGLSAGA